MYNASDEVISNIVDILKVSSYITLFAFIVFVLLETVSNIAQST